MSHSRLLVRAVAMVGLVLLVPAVPFLLLGSTFEERIQGWIQRDWSFEERFWLIVLVLSTDILLPVPSSGVSTYAGGTLGVTWGAVSSWLGMCMGAIVGFALARLLGQAFAERFGGRDVRELQSVARRYGDAALVITRPLPLLAEACVLLMGIIRLPWRRFLLPVLGSNLVISLAYGSFGAYFSDRNSLPAAIVASVLIPLALSIAVRRRLRATE